MLAHSIADIMENIIESTSHKVQPLPLLPSMHSTSCCFAESILHSGKLSPTECKVFHKQLLYFFYGKPVYMVSARSTTSRTDNIFAPFCFIVDSKKIEAKYIFPFDSGAYVGEKYNNIVPPEIHINNFALPTEIDAIPSFIQYFWNNNERYLQGTIGISKTEAEKNMSVSLLYSLLSSTDSQSFDDRAKTVEIITDMAVSLQDALSAVIIPKPFLRNLEFKKFISHYPKVEILTYHVHYPTIPNTYNSVVNDKAIDYLERMGYCHGI